MGIVGEPAFGIANADQVEQFDGPCPRRLGFKATMQKQTFANLLFDFMQRVERGHRLLEDHRDPVAANIAHDRVIGA